MKWFVVIWLLTAGIGVSYNVVAERRKTVQQLKEMEHSLKSLAYYMYRWRMPVIEAVEQVRKSEKGMMQEFFAGILAELENKQTEDFGVLWQEESGKIWSGEKGNGDWGRKVPEKIRNIWNDSFIYIPMEPDALHNRLTERAEEIADYTKEIQEKYRGEQRLVFTMGFFVSAFFCLILW